MRYRAKIRILLLKIKKFRKIVLFIKIFTIFVSR